MEEISVFIKGWIIGIAIAVPVGPIGILCIRRTLSQGRAIGFLSGIGAATADALYGAVAGLGLTFLSDFLIAHRIWLHLMGAGFLCILGIRTLFSKPSEPGKCAEGDSRFNAYLSTFFLTLTNPMTLLFFLAVFAGIGIGTAKHHYLAAGFLVSGVFIGSAIWWLFLIIFTGMLQGLFNESRMKWLNRISGLLIIAFGIFAFLDLF